MRVLFLLGLFLAFTAICSAQSVQFYDGLEHKVVRRNIDIRSHVENVVLQVELVNTGDQAASFYLFAVHSSKVQHLAFLEGQSKDFRAPGSRVEVSGVKHPQGTQFFKIDLPQTLNAGESVSFVVVASYTRTLTPYPTEISQNENQLVLYNDNLYYFSPYKTSAQSTNVKLASSNVESYTKKSAQQKRDEIEYGPFKDIKPLTISPLTIHYENNSPFATMSYMIKEIEISHFGNVAVEERYELVHTGAILKGHFSRVDYQRPGINPGASFRTLTSILPGSATNIYYRDRIGNISTSHVRHQNSDIHMEVLPRFPLVGGWKTDFFIGYNLPAHEFLTHKGRNYKLDISFSSSFPNVAIDEAIVRVILPEGAADYHWATPFEIDEQTYDFRVTYIDLTGRTIIELKKKNVVAFHNQDFQVWYNYSTLSQWRKPLAVAAVVLILLVTAIVSFRVDLSISHDEKCE